ncbi:TetR/AcrR family transcriptional regulator [Neorhizobium sp. JUb45]|uniref:TetR/AcrR family transcriptional regulator n=1 Tax=Neorhizobium sp. JUb45 TaxID=2485113 RepID=UPI0010462BA5|nr:TetR/AcrR family transcriptional regulator [Neorhizobium sp. JUb45]
MQKRANIISAAERVFEVHGFHRVGVDAILAPSGTSTRTLYKHFGSRDGLVTAVLEKRHFAFMARLQEQRALEDPIGHLFDVQEKWMAEHGTRGCMLLRAYSEYAGANEEIAAIVHQHKREFREEIGRRVEVCVGRVDAELSVQVWLLFEGATAAASVYDSTPIGSAKRAARALVASAREPS